MFSQRLYIRIRRDRITISSPDNERTYDDVPLIAIDENHVQRRIIAIGEEARQFEGKPGFQVVNPFGHPRVLVQEFLLAEKMIQHAVQSLSKGRWLKPLNEAIVHPEGKYEGGLTDVERRALTELTANAGCRKVAIYQGRPLTVGEVKQFEIGANHART